jgi:hypothetical protein
MPYMSSKIPSLDVSVAIMFTLLVLGKLRITALSLDSRGMVSNHWFKVVKGGRHTDVSEHKHDTIRPSFLTNNKSTVFRFYFQYTK